MKFSREYEFHVSYNLRSKFQTKTNNNQTNLYTFGSIILAIDVFFCWGEDKRNYAVSEE